MLRACSATMQKEVPLGAVAESVPTDDGFKARLQFVKLSYKVMRSQARASRGQVYSCDKNVIALLAFCFSRVFRSCTSYKLLHKCCGADILYVVNDCGA